MKYHNKHTGTEKNAQLGISKRQAKFKHDKNIYKLKHGARKHIQDTGKIQDITCYGFRYGVIKNRSIESMDEAAPIKLFQGFLYGGIPVRFGNDVVPKSFGARLFFHYAASRKSMKSNLKLGSFRCNIPVFLLFTSPEDARRT